MRAIILAAGRGSRLGPLTQNRPKCFVELAGRSLLSLQCAALRQAGIERIGVVAGYRKESFDGSGLEVIVNPRWEASNMVVSLTCAAAWLAAEPCIVSYSDIFYHPETVRRLTASTDDLAIAYDRAWQKLWERRFTNPLADAETFEIGADGILTSIGARAQSVSEIQGQYMGLLRFAPAGWSAVRAYLATLEPAVVDKLDMTSLLMRLIQHGQRIRGNAIGEAWGEVDNASDLTLYEDMIRRGEIILP